MDEKQVARSLGWFSLGLGLVQTVVPRDLARAIGVKDDSRTRTVMRLVGLREIGSGVGILTQARPLGWLWARVAGDAMDLTLLGVALTSHAARRDRVVAATAAVVGITALDVLCSTRLTRRSNATAARMLEGSAMEVKKAITVNRPPDEVYRFWHDFRNLPRFMDHLKSVQVTGDKRSHWTAKAPAGTTVEWDAETVDDRPNELIAWRSLAGASVDNGGSVRFVPAPAGRGTEVHVQLRYDPPAGPLGATVAKLFGEEPNQQMSDDLRRFKQVLETGEITLSEATAKGGGPAQPPAEMPQRRESA